MGFVLQLAVLKHLGVSKMSFVFVCRGLDHVVQKLMYPFVAVLDLPRSHSTHDEGEMIWIGQPKETVLCKLGLPLRDLGGIPPGILPGIARFWSPGFSFPAGIPAGFSAGNEIPGGQNLAEIPARFPAGSEIPGGQNLAGNLGGKRNSRQP